MENANENKVQNPLISMHSQYIRDLSLEIPHAPQIFQKLDTQPSIKIDVNIDVKHLEG
ncbi:MAG: protein-export chaperone SecB, partial [Alphaproteobacteria bacterium]|nr:protein-export chaperone SecB [Alphaproteobacteria bacterium]